ncbi:hypothetical protein [Chryseosolibacter indicus]|uniref:Uncharacterized protein n=1 Tax=Chryseosolibacter indicus TaxID=2782351 RepID=A0ABS5VP55_9BACT|nr:hypothetical protein [Chryseosolibacter indicus]MBT1703227.1 hypothetical protein [Chryseosolibacter indicus]
MNLIKTGLISIVLLITTATLFTRCKQEEKVDNTNAALALFNHDLDTLNYLVDSVFYVQVAGNDDVATLRSTFLTSRDAYKRIEFLVEFYMPETSRFVNGPPLPEIEVEEHEITEPHGFQVIEEILYPEYAESDKEHLLLEIKNLSIFIKKYNDFFGVKQITANHLLHALRMNVFRVIALGLSGFDTPLSKNGIVEAGTSFSTLNRYLNVFYAASKDEVLVNDLKNKIASASTYLIQQKDFDAFDRMYFIKKYANPIFRDMLTFQRSIGIEPLHTVSPFAVMLKTFLMLIIMMQMLMPKTVLFTLHQKKLL